MRNCHTLDLEAASVMVERARRYAMGNGWAVSIAVVDASGDLVAVVRLDGASPLSAELAIGKARTSARGRRTSKGYEDMVLEGRTSLLSVPNLMCLEGGLPLYFNDQCVGAIGVSGVASAEDTRIAEAGAAGLG